MPRLQDEVLALIEREGVVARRQHHELSGAIDWLVRGGRLRSVLPGVYGPIEPTDVLATRLAAVSRWDPRAVVVGAAAARLTFRPSAPVETVEVATLRRGSYPGFRLAHRVVPEALVTRRHGVRVASAALTALDLSHEGTDVLDEVLRARAATLDGLWEALSLTRGRRGNRQRLLHLIDSRDEPWSAAERLCHRLLREAGVLGWTSNLPVRSGGRLYFLDVAFPHCGVVVEVDGRLHEDDPDVFENDRRRQNDLVADGWIVLRFTWAMIKDEPDVVVETVRAALRAASGDRPLTFRGSICRESLVHAQQRRRAASTRRISGQPAEDEAS